MSRAQLRSTRCVHEPIAVLHPSERTAMHVMADRGVVSLALLPLEWTCAKCKRRLKARWYPASEGGA